jgi:hypothetical protein
VVHHQQVVVLNRERPVFVISHPDDQGHTANSPHRGRALHEALFLLAQAASPDPAFAEDMEAVLEAVGPMPDGPWARS